LLNITLSTSYVIKNGKRYLINNNNIIYDKLSIIAIYNNGNKKYFLSIIQCSKYLDFGKLIIKNCLLNGNTHNLFIVFKLDK